MDSGYINGDIEETIINHIDRLQRAIDILNSIKTEIVLSNRHIEFDIYGEGYTIELTGPRDAMLRMVDDGIVVNPRERDNESANDSANEESDSDGSYTDRNLHYSDIE